MAEKYLIVDQLKLNYEGLVDFNGFFNLIDSWFFEKGYDRLEKFNDEIVNEDGTRSLRIELRPWKKITNYAKNTMKIQIFASNMKEVEVEKDGNKLKLEHAKIQVIINGFSQTDWQFRWNDKPFLFFLHILYDKYFYGRYTSMFRANLYADVNDVHTKMKNFLNMYKFEGKYRPQWNY